MASKTTLTRQVGALDAVAVRVSLDESPALLDHRDERGRNWLHLCSSIDVTNRADEVDASIAIADDLLERGIDIDDAAFTEHDGAWRATALWYCVGRGRNLPLATDLLERGCDPNHSLWAAAFRDDLAAIDLLLDHGAELDAVIEQETPFLSAVKTSHFRPAWHLAERGADIDIVDPNGMTALHYMLKKSSDTVHFVDFFQFEPRIDIPGPDGVTAAELLSRKRDQTLRELAATAQR
jgi:ankyrin repeat protein